MLLMGLTVLPTELCCQRYYIYTLGIDGSVALLTRIIEMLIYIFVIRDKWRPGVWM
jgi:hypothetical protein